MDTASAGRSNGTGRSWLLDFTVTSPVDLMVAAGATAEDIVAAFVTSINGLSLAQQDLQNPECFKVSSLCGLDKLKVRGFGAAPDCFVTNNPAGCTSHSPSGEAYPRPAARAEGHTTRTPDTGDPGRL